MHKQENQDSEAIGVFSVSGDGIGTAENGYNTGNYYIQDTILLTRK